MVSFTVANFIDALRSIDRNLLISALLRVDSFKLHSKLLRGSTNRKHLKSGALKVHWNIKLTLKELTHLDGA